jgi:hypothetical protein
MIAGHRIRPTDNANDQLTWYEAAACRRLKHLAEGFVADNQMLFSGRRFTVSALYYFQVCAADTNRAASDEYSSLRRRGWRHIQYPG